MKTRFARAMAIMKWTGLSVNCRGDKEFLQNKEIPRDPFFLLRYSSKPRKHVESKNDEMMIAFRFKILKVLRKNISNVKNPTLREKVVRQNSTMERQVKESIRSEMGRPRPK